jgi:hypothetical protein
MALVRATGMFDEGHVRQGRRVLHLPGFQTQSLLVLSRARHAFCV